MVTEETVIVRFPRRLDDLLQRVVPGILRGERGANRRITYAVDEYLRSRGIEPEERPIAATKVAG
ncbi:MAG: hypothetical protein AABZ12_00240 [Planctomycetota bacterium]